MRDPASWAMFAVASFFMVFLVWKARLSVAARDPGKADARRRFAEARRRAKQAGADPKARAEALRAAALVALDELGRPGRAAELARRADALDPESEASVATVVRAMRAAGRYPALEKLLWRKLDEAAPGSPREQRLFDAIVALYEGPMRRPHQASALRRLRAAADGRG